VSTIIWPSHLVCWLLYAASVIKARCYKLTKYTVCWVRTTVNNRHIPSNFNFTTAFSKLRSCNMRLEKFLISSQLLFFKTAVKHHCVQSSYTYRYNKIVWWQIVSNNNDIASCKMQLCVWSSYTYNKMLWWQRYPHISLICKI